MPLFEYVCAKCGKEFEELVREGTVVKCPACQSGKVEKKLSTFAAQNGSSASPCDSGACPYSPPAGGGCCGGGACGHKH